MAVRIFLKLLAWSLRVAVKRHQVMKDLDVRELAIRKLGEKTWNEGSREYRKKQFEKDRPMIRENYRRYLQRALNSDKQRTLFAIS